MKKLIYVILVILILPFVLAGNEQGRIIKGGDLLVVDVDVKVDGKNNRNIEFGEEVKTNALPGSELIITIEIRNNNSGTIMQDVAITLFIDDLDFDETTNEEDIDPLSDEEYEIILVLPQDIRDRDYEFSFEISGELNNTVHEVEYEFDIDVDNPDTKTTTSTFSSGGSTSTQKQKIIDLETELAKAKEENTGFYEPYIECTTDLTAKTTEVSTKQTQIDSLDGVQGNLDSCNSESETKDKTISGLDGKILNLSLTVSNLQKDVKSIKDSRTYIIIFFILAAIGIFIWDKKMRNPDEESQSERDM